MNKQPQSRAPLIVAIVLLLLLVLYVASYLTLVKPGGRVEAYVVGFNTTRVELAYYRWRYEMPRQLFWPLEQIDRKVRPGAWRRPSGLLDDRRYLQIQKSLGASP